MPYSSRLIPHSSLRPPPVLLSPYSLPEEYAPKPLKPGQATLGEFSILHA